MECVAEAFVVQSSLRSYILFATQRVSGSCISALKAGIVVCRTAGLRSAARFSVRCTEELVALAVILFATRVEAEAALPEEAELIGAFGLLLSSRKLSRLAYCSSSAVFPFLDYSQIAS